MGRGQAADPDIMPLHRPAAAWLAIAAAGGAFAGCGGSTTTAAVPRASALATPTKAQATAYAQAVNLRAADLPGMSVAELERESPPSKPMGRELERCVGTVNPDLRIVKIISAKFAGAVEAQHEQINSNVEVWPTATLAARNNAASQSRRATSCAERLLPRLLAKSSGARVHYGRVTVTRLPDPLPGVDGSFGIRIAVAILGVPAAIEPTQPSLYIDGFSFLSGPAEVSMLATAYPQPVSEEVSTHLLGLLHSRAEAHKL
jgi:hypothetical protein